MFLVPNAPFRYVGRVRQGPEFAIRFTDVRKLAGKRTDKKPETMRFKVMKEDIRVVNK